MDNLDNQPICPAEPSDGAPAPTPPLQDQRQTAAPRSEVLPPLEQPGGMIPLRIRELARLTPEFLRSDGDSLLMHIEMAADAFSPRTDFDWLDCVRIGRHDYTIHLLQAVIEALRQAKRRVAVREMLKPGWLTAEGRPPALPDGVSDRNVAREARNMAGHTSLELQRYDLDPVIEEEVRALLQQANIHPFAIDAEAYRMNLPDQAALSQLIYAEETRRDQVIAQYERRQAITATSRR